MGEVFASIHNNFILNFIWLDICKKFHGKIGIEYLALALKF
jgi:hypothetical protein